MRYAMLSLLVLAGCGSPLAPSTNLVATECAPRMPLPILRPGELTESTQRGNVLTQEYTRTHDRLYVTFHRQGAVWMLCDWDTTDN